MTAKKRVRVVARRKITPAEVADKIAETAQDRIDAKKDPEAARQAAAANPDSAYSIYLQIRQEMLDLSHVKDPEDFEEIKHQLLSAWGAISGCKSTIDSLTAEDE